MALIGGAAAFAHCLGMCGGFALHLSQGNSRLAMRRQLFWHTGRIFMYMFFGTIAGFTGGVVIRFFQQSWILNGLAYLTGAVIVIMGLSLLGIMPITGGSALSESFFGSHLAHLFRDTTAKGSLLLGMATGCLPCPIVIGFLAVSMHLGTPLDGLAVMAAVGLGTTWSLLLLAFVGSTFTRKFRRFGAMTGGGLLVALGVVTILRGTPAFHQMLGCSSHVSASSGSCCPH